MFVSGFTLLVYLIPCPLDSFRGVFQAQSNYCRIERLHVWNNCGNKLDGSAATLDRASCSQITAFCCSRAEHHLPPKSSSKVSWSAVHFVHHEYQPSSERGNFFYEKCQIVYFCVWFIIYMMSLFSKGLLTPRHLYSHVSFYLCYPSYFYIIFRHSVWFTAPWFGVSWVGNGNQMLREYNSWRVLLKLWRPHRITQLSSKISHMWLQYFFTLSLIPVQPRNYSLQRSR